MENLSELELENIIKTQSIIEENARLKLVTLESYRDKIESEGMSKQIASLLNNVMGEDVGMLSLESFSTYPSNNNKNRAYDLLDIAMESNVWIIIAAIAVAAIAVIYLIYKLFKYLTTKRNSAEYVEKKLRNYVEKRENAIKTEIKKNPEIAERAIQLTDEMIRISMQDRSNPKYEKIHKLMDAYTYIIDGIFAQKNPDVLIKLQSADIDFDKYRGNVLAYTNDVARVFEMTDRLNFGKVIDTNELLNAQNDINFALNQLDLNADGNAAVKKTLTFLDKYKDIIARESVLADLNTNKLVDIRNNLLDAKFSFVIHLELWAPDKTYYDKRNKFMELMEGNLKQLEELIKKFEANEHFGIKSMNDTGKHMRELMRDRVADIRRLMDTYRDAFMAFRNYRSNIFAL